MDDEESRFLFLVSVLNSTLFIYGKCEPSILRELWKERMGSQSQIKGIILLNSRSMQNFAF